MELLKLYNIVLFDGNCMICSKFVRVLLKQSSSDLIFVSSVSQKGMDLRQGLNIVIDDSKLDSIFFIKRQTRVLLMKSEAVIEILMLCSWFYRALGRMIAVLPKRFRDSAYDVLANNRMRFGKGSNTCKLDQSRVFF